MRIGTGYDVHALCTGRRLVLGGVEIEHDMGLEGHSDADVLVHAVMDALLGAAALGDIGKLFPDSDDRYLNISSIELLKLVRSHLLENGFEIGNIDSTIVAQKPKLAPYIGAMRENIARALGIDLGLVSVKATTTEGLGFEGQCRGISAQAVCTVKDLKK